MVKNFLLIAAGGALGSMARYGFTLLASHLLVRGEWATFAANACGSFLIGLFLHFAGSEYLLFWTVGICGGFTTFSTFSSQTLQLMHEGQYLWGVMYMLGTMAVSLSMVALGWYCQQKLFG